MEKNTELSTAQQAAEGVVNAPTSKENAPAREPAPTEKFVPDYEAITAEFNEAMRDTTTAGREIAQQAAAAEEEAEAEATKLARATEILAAKTKGEEPAPAPDSAELSAVSPQLALLARREKELRESRANLEAEINRRVTEQIEAYKNSLKKKATDTPGQFYREELGIEKPEDIATDLWYESLGDEAPESFRRKYEARKLQEKLQAMEQKLEDFKREQATREIQAQRQAYVSGLQAQLNSLPDSMPYLRVEYEADPVGTLDALCTAAANMMGSGTIPTAKEVAEALEEQIQLIAERYSKVTKPPQATQAETSEPPLRTLSSTETTGRAADGAWDHEAALNDVIADLKRAHSR